MGPFAIGKQVNGSTVGNERPAIGEAASYGKNKICWFTHLDFYGPDGVGALSIMANPGATKAVFVASGAECGLRVETGGGNLWMLVI